VKTATLTVILLLVCAGSAHAWGIRTPSKNILCGDLPGGKIECIVLESDWANRGGCHDVTPKGYADIARRGRAKVGTACIGGLPFAFDGARTLRYGKSVTHRGITCTSRKSGLRCRNRSGHGFRLSRAKGVRF